MDMSERTITATVSDDRTIHGPNNLRFGPGDEFVGPVAEVRRLMRLGYLRDPRRPVVSFAGTHAKIVVQG
jgi:hypothetical protein